MRSVLIIAAFIFCGGLAAQDQASEIRAELVWVESEVDDHKLLFSQLIEEEWSDPLVVYNSENYITTPTIGTDLNDNKLIVWSEQIKRDTVLMSARAVSSDAIFQPAKKLNDFKAENLSPSVVVDSSNQLWVFWSSNYEGLDDIYYSRQNENKWSSPRRVHASNEVPDNQPLASLNEDHDVVVTWKTYDLQAGQYVTVQQVFAIDNSSKSRYKSSLSNNQQESISAMIMPDFLPTDSAVVLHFPNNRIEQSIRLDLFR